MGSLKFIEFLIWSSDVGDPSLVRIVNAKDSLQLIRCNDGRSPINDTRCFITAQSLDFVVPHVVCTGY